MENLRPMAANVLNKSVEEVVLPYDLLSLMNLTSLWTLLSHDINEMAFDCFFGRNKSCADSGQWRLIYTVVGPCYLYEAGK